MKNKITPSVILLIITVIFFIAGIFFMGIQARQQIQNTNQSLDTFISQVKDKKQALNDAQTSFSSAVKEKKDLLNYRQQKASGQQTAVQEHRDTQESSEAVTSVFNQDHS